MDIILNQMASLFLLMLTGYLGNRFHIIDGDFEKKVSRFIVNISLPATVLNSISGMDSSQNIPILPVFAAAVSVFLVSHVVCHIIQKIIRWDSTYELMLNYSNLGFMGIPIISTLFGEQYVLYVSIFMMTFNLSFFSYGVYLLSAGQSGSRFELKPLMTPGILSAFLAIGIYLLGIPLPVQLTGLFNSVGSTTTPLAMIVIGSTLAAVNFSSVFRDKTLYLFSFFKLLVMPVIIFLVLRLYIKERILLEIATILTGCPVAGNVSMLCMEYHRDGTLVSKGICISTLFSLFTIPLVSTILGYL